MDERSVLDASDVRTGPSSPDLALTATLAEADADALPDPDAFAEALAEALPPFAMAHAEADAEASDLYPGRLPNVTNSTFGPRST